MKKQFLLSLVAAFVLALSANAQGNTYNMKVKMADGTEITIGPNDIDNISFNEGEVVVSGTRLQEVLEKLASVRVWTIGDDGYWYVDGVKTAYFSRGMDGKDGMQGAPGRDGKDGMQGEPGRDGKVWTIGDDGYWYVDGVKTAFFSRGMDGKDGMQGVPGRDGKDGMQGADGANGRDGTSWEIGDDGYWYRNGTKTEHKAVRDADIQNLQNQINELKAKLY